MKKIQIPIDALYHSVTTPIANTINNDLKSTLGVNKDLYTIIIDELLPFKNKRFNLGKKTWFDKVGKKSEFMTSSIREETIESVLPTNNGFYLLNSNYLNLKTLYSQTNLISNTKIFSKNRSYIEGIKNRLLFLSKNSSLGFNTDLFYFINLNPFILRVLLNTHKNRVELLGDITFEDYFKTLSDSRATTLNNQSGTLLKSEIGFKEEQRGAFVRITSNVFAHEIMYDETEKYWAIEVELRLEYSKPVIFDFNYSPVIYNKLLPKEFVDNINLTKPLDNLYYIDNLYRNENMMYLNEFNYIRIPNFDTHNSIEDNKYSIVILTVLILVDLNNKKSIFNLKEIPNVEFNNDILEYLKNADKLYLVSKLKELFSFILYEDLIPTEYLEIDDDLNLTSNVDLDVTKTYRVVISLTTDLTILRKDIVDKAKTILDDEIINFFNFDNVDYRHVLKIPKYNATNTKLVMKHKVLSRIIK